MTAKSADVCFWWKADVAHDRSAAYAKAMRALRHWWLGRGPEMEVLRYAPEREPPPEDIEHFITSAKARTGILPLQTSRFVLRETYQALSWLKAYVHCEVQALRTTFVRENKSFYLAFLEHTETGDRSVAFRLTTGDLDGHTQWATTFRRVHFDENAEHYLCAEY